MRILAAIILAVAVALLCREGARRLPGVTLDQCLERPDEHDGTVVCTPMETRIGRIADGEFTIRWNGREMPVRGGSPRLKEGSYAQVRGVFRKEGYLEALDIAVGRLRPLKMAVSIVAGVIVIVLLVRGFRWDPASRAFVERTHERTEV
ncbi:MAG: hypothetical protein PHN82_11000 [bacterium]|nr:hypothetical protein [bacterium]